MPRIRASSGPEWIVEVLDTVRDAENAPAFGDELALGVICRTDGEAQ